MEKVDIAAAFDRRAERYDESAMHRWQADKAAAVTAPEPGQAVLDVATGTGLTARALATRMGNRGEIVGVDISRRMLDVARRTSPSLCRYVHADAHRLQFADERFDAAVCVAAVPHLRDPTTALAEWRRVCRAGARIVFTVPADGGITEFRLLQQAASSQGIRLADPNAGMGDEQRLVDAAEMAGMACEGVTVDAFTGPLTSNPDAAWQRFLTYGLGEPLRAAPRQVRDLVRHDYRQAFGTEHAAGRPAEHTVLFASCRVGWT